MKRDSLIILSLSFIFFIFGNWILSFTSLDEGRNFYATIHMLKTGDFLIPYYNCDYRFEKPPLLYWLGSVFLFIFKIPEFSARLVSGVSATLTALLVYFMGLKFFSREKALFSAISFTLFVHTWIEARAYVPEFTLVFFSTLGVYLFISERFTLGWVALSFAFLTKGPVGVILPIGVYLLWKRNLKFFDLKGIFLFLLIGFSWYFLMIYKFGLAYFFKFFIYENIYRYTGVYKIHSLPFYFYIIVIFINIVLFLPIISKILFKFDKHLKPFLLWFLIVLVFYSFSENKLHHYILFSYPPLAIIIGNYLNFDYIKKVTKLGILIFSILLISTIIYENKRFTPKAVEFLKTNNSENIYFYKHENSAIVAYLYKCIRQKSKQEISKNDLIITKEKHLKDFENYELILKGIEFEGKEVLIRIK